MKLLNTINYSIYFGTEIPILERANALRKELTNAEHLLWAKIRKRQIWGYKFRRQHPISQFVADFYCHEKKLVIEVDGGYHNKPEQKERDEGRTFELEKLGLTVMRFTNEEVEKDLDGVIGRIREFLEK